MTSLKVGSRVRYSDSFLKTLKRWGFNRQTVTYQDALSKRGVLLDIEDFTALVEWDSGIIGYPIVANIEKCED